MYYRSQLCCFVFLSPPTDSTLTLTKLTQTLGSVDNWDDFRGYLDIPPSQYNAIKAQHPTKAAQGGGCYGVVSNTPSSSILAACCSGPISMLEEHDVLQDPEGPGPPPQR